ncbi:MAG: hypothetical protein KDK54_16940 [Leptospiraceae bacterium]|nr:hypothetical protein [Leptospiraceae bacterium]
MSPLLSGFTGVLSEKKALATCFSATEKDRNRTIWGNSTIIKKYLNNSFL